ncbi:hypothetical protein HOLleu_22171 [Holothuria leucospilota]|uniref:Uncharacterized protein n=1 Tax=Holothuria leucospilota TaxID=206669 RepID=A0A9Q1BYS5_HOLLE|nr:hypothetical protein HOLleu_22171 [Holothuria leucospilota]
MGPVTLRGGGELFLTEVLKTTNYRKRGFLAYLRTLSLRDTILLEQPDPQNSERCYSELVNLTDDKCLALIIRDAPDDGKKALGILRTHFAGNSKPRIIALYTELTSLMKDEYKTVTDYILRAERAVSALRNAGETISDGLMIAMVFTGLPRSFRPFTVNI